MFRHVLMQMYLENLLSNTNYPPPHSLCLSNLSIVLSLRFVGVSCISCIRLLYHLFILNLYITVFVKFFIDINLETECNNVFSVLSFDFV